MKLELVSKHALDSSRATPLLFIHGAGMGRGAGMSISSISSRTMVSTLML
jgi:hypothetical protein